MKSKLIQVVVAKFKNKENFCIKVANQELFETLRDISHNSGNGFFDDFFIYDQFSKISNYLCFRKRLFKFIEPKELLEMSCSYSKPEDLVEIL